MSGYKIWYSHGEDESMVNDASTSVDRVAEPTMKVNENVGTL